MDFSALTPEVCRKLYLEDLLSDGEIAELYGTYQVKISRLRKKWGIPSLGKTGRISASLPPLTEKQVQLLTGSLLGDGTVSAPSNRTARFSEGHSLKQRGYTDWKGEILGDYVSSYHEGSQIVRGKTYRTWNFATKTCTQLRFLYDLFYPKPDRVRVFPSDLYRRVTPFVLAVWFMDDGSCTKFHPSITFGLDDLSLKRATRALRTLALKPEIHEDPRDGSKSIMFPGQSDLFFEIVGPHIPPCMAYKFPDPSERRDQDRNAKRLTPDKARDLYQGGMTLVQVAEMYGVGKSTVRRRLASFGPPKKMGRPRKIYSLLAATESLTNLSHEEWVGGDKGAFEGRVLDILVKTPFPLPTPLGGGAAQAAFHKLQRREVGLSSRLIRPMSPHGLELIRPHFPNRYRARYYASKLTAYESWHLKEELLWAVRFQLKAGDPVIPHRVLRALTMKHRTPTLFKPIVAKFFCETYGRPGGLMWDPCAGYGGRLLGCLAGGMDYVGTDVDGATVRGNQALAASLGFSSRVRIEQCPAEKFAVPKVDLVFTSPPYFDREQYRGGSQSWKTYPTLAIWLGGFLSPVLRSAFGALSDGGVCAINIADLKQRVGVVPLVDSTIKCAVGEGFTHEDRVYMPLSRLNKSAEDAREPILIFRKGTSGAGSLDHPRKTLPNSDPMLNLADPGV